MYSIHRKELVIISTARISVNVDEEVKRNAQRVFSEIGIDITTAINSFLKTVVREERIPYELRTEKAYVNEMYILAKLEESITEANDPNTKRLSNDEVMDKIMKRREARTAELMKSIML